MKKINFVWLTILIFLTSCNATDKPQVTNSKENTNNTYSKYQPIVIDSFLIGGFFENNWIDQQKTFDLINITENYKVYKKDEYISDSIGEKIKLSKEDKIFSNSINILKLDKTKDKNIIAISANFEILKRKIIEMKNNNRTYKNIVKDILIESDMKKNDVVIKQLYKFDIDDDNESEYLIVASDLEDDQNTQIQKKYSMIILRKNIDGIPKNIFLKKTFYNLPYNKKNTFSEVVTIADLNNDNHYEIIIKDEFPNSLKYSLYKLIDNKFEILISTGYSY